MADNKISFQQLTEDLAKLNEESVEKSDGLENAEPVKDPAEEPKEEEKVEEAEAEKTEEPEAEEKKEEEEPAKQPEEGEKVEEEPKPEADPEKGEEVEKAEKPEKEEDDKAAKDKGKDKKKKVEDKEEKDEVKKSAESTVSEADFIGAFEAVVKSFGSVQKNQVSLEEKVEALSKSLAEVISLLKPEEVEKSEGEEKEEEVEEIEKSAKEEEAPEGKATEAIYKSEDGLAVSDTEVEEQEEPKVFNAVEHVDAVVSYFMNPENALTSDERFNLRQAVHRVSRNEATEADIAAFKFVTGFDQK